MSEERHRVPSYLAWEKQLGVEEWFHGTKMAPFLELIDIVITFYMWVVIIYVIVSWLVAFEIINTRNHFVRTIGDTLYRLTEPALRPIRRIMPNLGGVDLAPLVLILLLWFVRRLMMEYFVY